MLIDSSYLPYCETDVETAQIQEYIKCGEFMKASKKLKCSHSTVSRAVYRVKARAEARGFSPENDMQHAVPESFIAKGVSTLYDMDGNVKSQWVKATLDEKRYKELLREAASAFAETIKPEKAVKHDNITNEDLLNVYVITDYHLGMKSWKPETGADWDLHIAEELLIKWFATAIKQAPDASVGILANLGDLMHFDGLEALTPTSGHPLDADTRFQLVVRVAIRALRRIISMLLSKHEHVHIVMAEGNHDIASSVWLREMMSALYDTEPRVTIDQSPDIYYCYEHGLTSVFFHHGHKAKFDGLDDVLAAKFRDVFGRTKFSYAHTGHYHHNKVRESSLMTVEQHRTLAAPDAYSSRGGWLSGRDAKVIVYHKQYGEIGRLSISPEMVV